MFCWAASHKNECPQGFLHFGSMCKPRLTQQDHTQCSNLSQFELISNIRHISTVCEHTASRRKNLLGPSGLFRTLMTSTLWGHASLCKFQTYVELTRRTTFRKTCHRVLRPRSSPPWFCRISDVIQKLLRRVFHRKNAPQCILRA